MPDMGKFEKIEIGRTGTAVVVKLRCADEYEAMMIYDFLAEEMATGRINLKINVNAPPQTS